MAGIEVSYNVLNQRLTPAFYASSLATRPAAGFAGRVFIDSDSPSTGIYRDTGSAWVQVADQGAGTTGTLQNVTTNGNTSNTGISVTANGIGIGTTIPASNRLDIHSASGLQGTFNGTGVTNAGLQLQSAGVGKWNVRNNYNAGANDFEIYDVLNAVSRLSILNTGVANFTNNVNVNGAINNINYALNVTGAANISGDLRGGLIIGTSTYGFTIGDLTNAPRIAFGLASNTYSFLNSSNGQAALQAFDGLFTNRISANVPSPAVTMELRTKISEVFIAQLSTYDFIGSTAGTRLLIGFGTSGGNTYTEFRTNGTGGLTNTPMVLNANGGNCLVGKTTDDTICKLQIEGKISVSDTPIYASNALAIAGGLIAGNFYRNAVGVLSVVF